MMLSSQTLLRLPVVTRNGVRLGKIVGFDFEAETQTIMRYHVRRTFFRTQFLISRTQVVSINEKEMIVEDLMEGESARLMVSQRKTEAVSQSGTFATQKDNHEYAE